MTRALLVIDVQDDYFPGGAYPLVGPEAAADATARLLAAFRASGEPVVHVQHRDDSPDAPSMRPGTPGIAIHAAVAPAPGETVITKGEPNAFLGTDLADVLAGTDADELVVAGMMSSMCVDATVRSAVERGHRVTVVSDACAAPDLEHGGVAVPGAMVHAAFMAALADGYADVVTVEQALERSPST